MKPSIKYMGGFVAVTSFIMCVASQQAVAWDPPAGDRPDHAFGPATPGGLVPEAHGYITQNGISMLYNDGYWFAAQDLRDSEQELLNGVRAADTIFGDQVLHFQVCVPILGIFDLACYDIDWFDIPGVTLVGRWPYAADNHYFNPDTREGLDPGTVKEVLNALTTIIGGFTFGTVKYQVDPPLIPAGTYASAIDWFAAMYGRAVRSGRGLSTDQFEAGGRKDLALTMFYVGWASHFLQDLNVVHHTFDQFDKHHAEYEKSVDGMIEAPPPIDGRKQGIYLADLPATGLVGCESGQPSCLLAYAAKATHDRDILDAADNKDYAAAADAVFRAQRLQAGLYAAFLSDIGRQPVHMSAVVAAF